MKLRNSESQKLRISEFYEYKKKAKGVESL